MQRDANLIDRIRLSKALDRLKSRDTEQKVE